MKYNIVNWCIFYFIFCLFFNIYILNFNCMLPTRIYLRTIIIIVFVVFFFAIKGSLLDDCVLSCHFCYWFLWYCLALALPFLSPSYCSHVLFREYNFNFIYFFILFYFFFFYLFIYFFFLYIYSTVYIVLLGTNCTHILHEIDPRHHLVF